MGMKKRSPGKERRLPSLKRNRDRMEGMMVVIVRLMMMLPIMNKRLERNLTKIFLAKNQEDPKHLMVARDSTQRRSHLMVLNLTKNPLNRNLEVMINVIRNLKRNGKLKFSTLRVLDQVLREVLEKIN